MSPKETMNICQELYQNGHITYMRTESKQDSQQFLEKASKYIESTFFSKKYIGNHDKLVNKNSNNPHEAIRVTQIELKTIPGSSNNRTISLYKLIWRNSIESCMSQANYENQVIELKSPSKDLYIHNIEIPLFLGWKIVQQKENILETQNSLRGLILYFQSLEEANKTINFKDINAEVHVKNNHSYYTEAGLVNKLESLEIGRPSTYSTIIETLKDRGYVKKQHYDGIEIECNNYVLEDKEIILSKTKKFFGAEKNKLFIQPIGKLALEFLLENFDSVFTYEYTKTMENKLDLISNKEIDDWAAICKECYNELKTLSSNMKNLEKKSYPICENYDFIFEKYGPVIKHLKKDGEVEYLQGNKQINIDIDKLKNREYTLEELLDPGDICLGEYEEHKMYIKHGRYGYYIEWGENKESIKEINKSIYDITMNDIIEFLKEKKSKDNNNILRELTDNANIRKGKYGAYVFYKTANMKKPSFLNIKKCPHGFLNCEKEILIEWINNEYKINI